MSGYIVEEDNNIYRVHNNIESECYWVLYSKLQRRRFKKVLNQLNNQWSKVKDSFDIYIHFDMSIDIFMPKIYKIYFMTLRLNFPDDYQMTNKRRTKKLNRLKSSKSQL